MAACRLSLAVQNVPERPRWNASLGPKGLDLRKDDLAIGWLPLYHDMGLIGFVLGTLICDLPTVLLPTEAFVRRPGIWMEAISRYGGTITFAPNFAYALAARRTRDRIWRVST